MRLRRERRRGRRGNGEKQHRRPAASDAALPPTAEKTDPEGEKRATPSRFSAKEVRTGDLA